VVALLQEYARRRTLVWALTRRHLIARYRGTALGFLWTFVHPLLLFAVYALVFGVFVRLDVRAYPAFLLAGLLPWTWFAQALAVGTHSILADGPWIRQAAFSPAISPLVACAATAVNFALELPVVVGLLALLGVYPGLGLVALPAVAAIQLALVLGITLATSALTVRYRDTEHLVAALLPIWFFLTPVLYPLSQVPARYAWLLDLNPCTHLAALYQAILFEGRLPDPGRLLAAAAFAAAALALGAWTQARLRDRIPEEL